MAAPTDPKHGHKGHTRIIHHDNYITRIFKYV